MSIRSEMELVHFFGHENIQLKLPDPFLEDLSTAPSKIIIHNFIITRIDYSSIIGLQALIFASRQYTDLTKITCNRRSINSETINVGTGIQM